MASHYLVDNVVQFSDSSTQRSAKLSADDQALWIDAFDNIEDLKYSKLVHSNEWKNCNKLTWSIRDFDSGIYNLTQVENLIKEAFGRWSSRVNLTCEFVRDQSTTANIRFTFAHWNSNRYLAVAVLKKPGDVDIYINSHVEWEFSALMRSARKVNLLYVLLHEIGHALGIEHINKLGSIMYPIYDTTKHDNNLTEADLEEGYKIYGKRSENIPAIPREPPKPPVTEVEREREEEAQPAPPPTSPKIPRNEGEREGEPIDLPTKEELKMMTRLFNTVRTFFDREMSRLEQE